MHAPHSSQCGRVFTHAQSSSSATEDFRKCAPPHLAQAVVQACA